jgi:galactonate dehydratase
VIMPDVKYAGGLREVMRLAEAQIEAGVTFSPHNPSGPVAHAASLEVCAAVGDGGLLEHQFDESPLFEELVAGSLPRPKDGMVERAAGRLGTGIRLDLRRVPQIAESAA